MQRVLQSGTSKLLAIRFLLFSMLVVSVQADVRPLASAVDSVDMTVSDMDRAVDFYSRVLSFKKVWDTEIAGETCENFEGVFGVRMRVVRMQASTCLSNLSPRDGSPFPLDEHSNDVIHRQTVLVTQTADQAARDLLLAKVNFVSSGVIANQKDKLGYRAAFIVRDPDGRAIEIEQK